MMKALEVRHLSKAFRGFALQDVSFSLEEGYITGFIGENGSGKSTTIKLILQLLIPDSGEIRIFGLDPSRHSREIKERIGFVFDEHHFYEHLTADEMKRIIAPFYKRWNERLFQRYVRDFDLPLHQKIKHLSKGMKMKLSLAFALAHEPDLIIMDEPTSGLDPVFRREILDLLREIMLDERKTIFFSTHITTDLEQIADRIIFLHKGRVVWDETKDRIEETYALVKGDTRWLTPEARQALIGVRETDVGFEGLAADADQVHQLLGDRCVMEKPSLEDIMYFTIKGGRSA
nr:ABC transporter ATP-binding protein [Polycladomyces abyssicola]